MSLTRAAAPVDGVEFFESRIRPVLAQDCYECHRTGGKQKGGLALDHRAALRAGGDSGPVVVPGDPEASLLLQAIRHDRDDLAMPKAGAKLDPAVIADFATWIRLGAPDPREEPPSAGQLAADTEWPAVRRRRMSWWSFQPVVKPDLADFPAAFGSAHPVDRLLAPRQSAAGLVPAPRATPEVLLRRLSFALRGLPPAPDEVAAFAADAGPGAYAARVDAFLASPRFGERWARHWMDWVRYADSHGSEGDAPIPNAWRYRDYLIRALNADVPYDQLVREHLAGDLLARPRLNPGLGLNESKLGVAQLRMVLHGFAPTDALEELVRFTDDQINVVSKAFLGLTVSCARCHDHKFDPVSQRDFTAWYGIFSSTAPAMLAVDAPDPAEPARRAELSRIKRELRSALAAAWAEDAAGLAGILREPPPDLRPALAAAKDPGSFLHALVQPPAAVTAWRGRHAAVADQRAARPGRRWDLTRAEDLGQWLRDGPGALAPARPGDFAVAASGDRVVSGIYPAGLYSHLLSTKDRAVVLSPKVRLEGRHDLWLRLMGEGGAFARFVVQNYPREGVIYPVTKIVGAQRQWARHALEYWDGDRIHVELSTAADQPVLADVNAARSWFGISEVVIAPVGTPAPLDGWEFAAPILAALGAVEAPDHAALADAIAVAARAAVRAWADDAADDGQAGLLDQLLRAGLLRNRPAVLPAAQPILHAYRTVEEALRVPTRAPGVLETGAVDQPLFARGNHKQPGEIVPRHFLEAWSAAPYDASHSGRLALAEDIVRPENPLAARVIVNRVWHHLFGRGLVATPDNFGRLGQAPSHPELLDYLASWFVENRWSIKALVRLIVTSEAWQRASEPPAGAREKDPDNLLLARGNVRRLEAEAVRDALLDVSGELRADEMNGPPVTGRAPRRSVYLRVKRNDLDPFLAAFDAPVPSGTVGRRDVTNVPAQSLTLLNDPFVRDLAGRWAARVEAAHAEPGPRIDAMYRGALARPPTEVERRNALGFVERAKEEQAAAVRERAEAAAAVERVSARLAELESAATARVRAGRAAAGPAPALPVPLAAWDFRSGPEDSRGTLHGRLLGEARIDGGALLLDGKTAHVATVPLERELRARTLAAWVRLARLDQKGGGVMTVQTLDGAVFDAIVFAEREPRRWLAGSNNGVRSRSFGGLAEEGAAEAFVHLALTYAEDGTITAYRNGQPYGSAYQAGPLVTFPAGQAQVLFGNRHGSPGGNRLLAGQIRGARLYDRALTPEEVAALAAAEPRAVTAAELVAVLTPDEAESRTRWQAELAVGRARREALERRAGLATPWAELAHALFNVKEFIFIR